MRHVFLAIAMIVTTFYGYSQNKTFFIGPEFGITSVLSEMSQTDFIRGDIPSPSSYQIESIVSRCNQSSFGFKFEKFMYNEKIGISAGLNYQNSKNSIGKISEWSAGNDYFYWQMEDGSNITRYYRVKGVEQNNSYVGVPLEIKYFISEPYTFRFYGKLGLNLNLLIDTKSEISYVNREMEKYAAEMIAMLEKPNPFYSSMHLAGGIMVGNQGHTSINFEVQTPYFFLKQPGGINNAISGVGFEFSVLFPLKTNAE